MAKVRLLFAAAIFVAASCQKGGSRGGESITDLINRAASIDSTGDSGLKPLCDEGKANKDGNCPEKEYILVNDTQFVCSTQKYSLSKIPDQFSAVNPNADILWPGALIQGKSAADGILNPIPIKERQPGTIVLALATGGGGPFSKQIDVPSLASATEGINAVLASNLHGPTPAKFSYRIEEIHNSNQLRVAFGINVKSDVDWGGSGSLDFNSGDEKNRVLVEFSQEYFTMAFEPPAGPAGVFQGSVSPDMLKPYVQSDNPALYISSVTYGRRFYFLFESSASMKDLKAAVEASYTAALPSIGGNAEIKYRKVLNESNIRSFGLGGSANEAIKAATGGGLDAGDKSKADIINEFLMKEASFGASTPGAPISYSLRYLNNSKQVLLGLTTEFSTKNCSPVDPNAAPPVWSLKVTLNKLLVHDSRCDVFGGNGDFYSCLRARNGTTANFSDVLCQKRDAASNVDSGKEITYGNSAIIKVPQAPGQKFELSGFVKEADFGPDSDEHVVKEFVTSYELSQDGNWIDFGDGHKSIRGTVNSCSAELFYTMEWIDTPTK